ncbi:MAG: hypothetical protein QXD03_01915 [Candidatus Anstonellales archaeon]
MELDKFELDLDKMYNEFDGVISVMQDDIDHINSKLIEINKYITMINAVNKRLEQEYVNETDPKTRSIIFKNIKSNIDQICALEEVYNKYLSIKQNYRHDQSMVVLHKNRLLSDIFIKRESIEKSSFSVAELFKNISALSESKIEIDSEEYKLD